MMGFCVFNNVAVAASRALQMGVNRVMILDWDVHHGNGTQSCFEEDDRVLFVSIHRYDSGGFYPTGLAGGEKKTGFGKGAGFNVNIAWNEGGAGDAEYAAAFELVILPIAVEYAPELIIISSGFDSACGDPLGNCNLTPQGYAWLTHHLITIQPRILLCLEGGYNCNSVARSFSACIATLLGVPAPNIYQREPPSAAAFDSILRTALELRHHWASLRRKSDELFTINR
mmetsp:Transcript_8716/g.22254  ORF Transcript_8716/g.22254 Transcript_8716/m.22254 type:complete len:228 (-) Transcript_8716:450-1133(-)